MCADCRRANREAGALFARLRSAGLVCAGTGGSVGQLHRRVFGLQLVFGRGVSGAGLARCDRRVDDKIGDGLIKERKAPACMGMRVLSRLSFVSEKELV